MTTRVRSGFLDFDWGQLHIRGDLQGSDKQPIVLLHQNPLSTFTYEQVLASLSEHFRPIAIDTPGFGLSSDPPETPTLATYAEIIHQATTMLGLQRPLLIGQHTGACIAVELALTHPDAVSGAALIGVPCVSPAVAETRLNAKHPFEITEDGAHLTYIWTRMQNEQYPGLLSKEIANRHVIDHLLAGPENYLHAYKAVYQYPIQKRLTQLSLTDIPVLLLSGSADCIKEFHDSTTEFLPEARTITFEGCSDFIMDEGPDRFGKEIADFAARTIHLESIAKG